MTMYTRRKATMEELTQGEREIHRAHERMQGEAASRGELALEDRNPGTEEEAGRREDSISPLMQPRKPEAEELSKVAEVTPKEARKDRPKEEEVRTDDPKVEAKTTPKPSFTPPPQAAGSPKALTPPLPIEDMRTPAQESEALEIRGQSAKGTREERRPGEETPKRPLFSEAQIEEMERLRQRSPLIAGRSWRDLPMEVARPSFLEEDMYRRRLEDEEKERRYVELLQRYQQDQEDKKQIRDVIRSLADENSMLKGKLSEMEENLRANVTSRFATPEDSRSEDGPRGRQDKEAVRPPEGSIEEDGPRGRQGKEAARSPPKGSEEDGPRGRKEKECPAPRRLEKELSKVRSEEEEKVLQKVLKDLEVARRREEEKGYQPKTEGRSTDEVMELLGQREEYQGKKEDGSGYRQEPQGGSQGRPPDEFQFQQMQFMTMMLESMKEMQSRWKKEGEEQGMMRGVEVVRTGLPELPRLPPWNPSQGPLQLGDWLLVLEPVVADLTTSSEEWWKKTVSAAEDWYKFHMALSPLDRVHHQFDTPAALSETRWQRLERRMAGMLLQAIPEGVKEELVAARRMNTFGILTYLMVIYCPGGVVEKQTLLKNLEEPAEVGSLQEAPSALRRWMRWLRRTQEIGAVSPDPSLLMKGLNRLSRRILESQKDLQFRVALARNNLGVDVTPTHATVAQFATHLLAEMEQVAMAEKRAASTAGAGRGGDAPGAKARRAEAKEAEKGGDRPRDAGGEKTGEDKGKRCRFFLTEAGCRRGKECSWSHDQKDEKRRCWTCGSTEHLAPACTRPKSTSSPQKQKMLKPDEETLSPTSAKSPVSAGSGEVEKSEGEAGLKELVEEANRILRTLTPSTSPSATMTTEDVRSEGRDDMMERLQQQLNALKVQQKTFKLQRLKRGDLGGLIDLGATHPLRPAKKGEDLQKMPIAQVTLASGEKVEFRVSEGGSMVTTNVALEPIVPMGLLVEKLGCLVEWKEDALNITHPKLGPLEVKNEQGCPQVQRKLALQLIEEIELQRLEGKLRSLGKDEELEWMKKLVEVHPVLKTLPEAVRSRLAVAPGGWEDLPANRRCRRKMKNEGFVAHLYAGEDAGYTLGRAWKQGGGDPRLLLEVDLLRGPEHDMLRDDGVYRGLVRAALDGCLRGIVGGPNCRSRSVLRHYPIPDNPAAPRPVRAWGGMEFGRDDLTPAEKQLVIDDDVLLWRMIYLYMVSRHVRQAKRIPSEVHFTLEQPASPRRYMPAVVSLWDTLEWKALAEEYGWKEYTFNQSTMGGEATKPTTMGSSADLRIEEYEVPGKKGGRIIKSSKDLARWPPGVMNLVSDALMRTVWDMKPKLRVLSWSEHLAYGHVPFRRDCRVCQESLQQSDPHRRVKHPLGGVLSVDVAGPMKPAMDQGGHQARWLLIATMTWRVPKGTTKMMAEPEEEPHDDDPPIEESKERRGGEVEGEKDPEEEKKENEESTEVRKEAEDPLKEAEEPPQEAGDPPQEAEDHLPQVEEKPEDSPDIDETEMRVFRLVAPMVTKTAKEVTRTTMDFVLQLRMDGFHVSRIHSDQGHEFAGEFRRWCNSRGIILTKTPGEDPRCNGRVETAVKSIKSQIRRALRQAHRDHKFWPWAARYVNEVNRCVRCDQTPSWPPFMQEVRTRKRTRRMGVFDPSIERVLYLCPSKEDHGHWVMKEGEAPRLTRSLVRRTAEPYDDAVWLAMEKDIVDEMNARRRIRQKTAVRRSQVEAKEDSEDEVEPWRRIRVMRMIEEEAKMMIDDSPELAEEERQMLSRMKKMIEEEEKEEEVLQTRIVSPKQVSREWDLWLDAIDSEVRSLTIEKEALEMLSPEDHEKLKESAKGRGQKVEYIPSKVIFTLKPGPSGGKRKARWVVCGNFEEKKESEENYSSGADATSFRILVWCCARHQWSACILDVKTAFLNAGLEQAEEENPIVIQAPAILVEKKYVTRSALYRPRKAVYGFRRSPRLWGGCRDQTMEKFKVKVTEGGREITLKLRQLISEPNLWRILEEGKENEDLATIDSGSVRGLVMTYVDDICIAAPPAVMQAVAAEFRATWVTSVPEEVTEAPVRFLGMDVRKKMNQGGREEWKIDQEAYVRDCLQKMDEMPPPRKIPVTRDQSMMVEDPQAPEVNRVRMCQKAVGEVLWIVSRSRPDLMYTVARMGSSVTKATTSVLQTAAQAWGYLRTTCADGLKYADSEDEKVVIQVYSDASFAPDSEESHGAFVVQVNGCALFWRSGRQASITLSTAEAELNELVEGMNAAESVSVIIEEIYDEVEKSAMTDSQSAVAIMTNEGGSWRTRHLRLRSSYARQAILHGQWKLTHVPGEVMIADIGTKALTAQRMEKLKELMGMECQVIPTPGERGEEKKKEDLTREETRKEDEKRKIQAATSAVRLITLAAAISTAKGEKMEEETKEDDSLRWIVVAYTILVVMATLVMTLGLQWLWKAGARKWTEARRRTKYPTDRSRPTLTAEFQPKKRGGGKGEKSSGSGEVRGEAREEERIRGSRRARNEERDRDDEERRRRSSEEEEDSPPRVEREESPPMEDMNNRYIMTRYGTVFHKKWDCKYLNRAGPAKNLDICPRCRARNRQHRVSQIYADGWQTEVHLDRSCPHFRHHRMTLCCTDCRTRDP